MHHIEFVESYPLPISTLFTFFAHPANVLAIAPTDSGLRLVQAPDTLSLGATFTIEARRWGLSRRIVTEVIEYVPHVRIVEQQQTGPFTAWRLERHFRALDDGCELRELVTFAPPTGLLGLTLTAARIDTELRAAYHDRPGRVLRLLNAPH